MGRSSSSDSNYSYSSLKRKKKSSRRRRSRSSSYESSRRKSGKSSRRRRSRSKSLSSDRSSSVSKRRRSRSRSRDRPRHHKSKSRNKKSRDRSPSPVRRKKHVDAVMGVGTGTLKDVMDILPGFSKMTPAEQSRIRIQRALNKAVETSLNEEEGSLDEEITKDEQNSFREQIDRAKAIQAVDDDDDDDETDFLPSHFRSSTKSKAKAEKAVDIAKKNYTERESTHEMAIFGHANMLNLDDALKQNREVGDEDLFKAKKIVDYSQRDPKTLVADELLVNQEQAAARWRSKLISLHHRFAEELRTAV